MWYSQRVTRRRKLCIQAKSRSTFQRRLVASQLGVRLASCCAGRRFGAISSMPYSSSSFSSSPIRVVGFVADEPGGQLVEEASGKNLFDKLALGW